MDVFLGFIFLILIAFGFLFYSYPSHWNQYVKWLPLASFFICARAYGMTPDAWQNAFILAGFVALLVFIVLWQHAPNIDRLVLGLNIFFLLGAYAIVSGNNALLEWYSASQGGPLFSCVVAVGLLATLFSPHGFVGMKSKNKQAIQYASFLLLAASVVALIWSVTADDRGILFAVALPFLILLLIRDQLARQI